MTLEIEFDHDMRNIYEKALASGYNAHIFLRMIEEHGGVETAKRLLTSKDPQSGLFKLWELNMLDDSMEALVLKEKYLPLFTVEEIEHAKKRLKELDYFK